MSFSSYQKNSRQENWRNIINMSLLILKILRFVSAMDASALRRPHNAHITAGHFSLY